MPLPSVNGVTLPCLYQATFGLGFPIATHFIGFKVDVFSIKTSGDGGKDLMFGSAETTRYVHAIVIVESLYWP